MRKTILIFSCCAFFALAAMAQRTEALLEKNWKFTKGDVPEATQTNFDDSKWDRRDMGLHGLFRAALLLPVQDWLHCPQRVQRALKEG